MLAVDGIRGNAHKGHFVSRLVRRRLINGTGAVMQRSVKKLTEVLMASQNSHIESAQAREIERKKNQAVEETVTVPEGGSYSVLPGPPLSPAQQQKLKHPQDDTRSVPVERAAPAKRTSDHLDEEE